METVNGVTDGDKGGPPPPSPLTGCYLLIVVGEPHSEEHKDIILQRISKGLLSWDLNDCLVDLEKELAIITEQALEGEEARYGERLIQFASENLVTEILIHPVVSTLAQCMRNLLSSFTRHRHIIHSGYTFAANGSWALQDGTFSLADFSEAFQELEVQRVIRAYENGITLDLHCSPEGDWSRLPKEPFTKACKLRVNPTDVLTSGSPAITNFINYISPFLVSTSLENLLESSDVVGNIRFSRPTLYVFPGGQGDAALFGINGFNMLLDGGFSRKACFWDFVRHLDRLDAVLMTRLNNSNVGGISSVLRRKKQDAVYPQIGHFFCNIQERKAMLSPDGDKDKDPLLINLLEEGQEIISNLRHLNLNPQVCYRDSEPINLYHKVGHGTLDMYVLSPAKDSKEVREFLQKWNQSDQKLFANSRSSREFSFPIQNLISIAALLVWQPANPSDTITRILFPGSSPQKKIFEGLDRLKNLEFIKHAVCTEKSLVPSSMLKKSAKESLIDKVIPKEKVLVEKKESKIIENNVSVNGDAKEKIVKKSDSTESERSTRTKKIEEPKIIENGDKPKPKPKPSRIRGDSQQRKKPAEKKASPTTPKKTVENGEAKRPTKPSPISTPAKSTKDANNRKVIESKARTAKPPPAEPKPKVERKPISRRPKTMKAPISPVKKLVNGVQKPDSISKKGKLDKEGTTDSSTVSTPSADQESLLKKDISKLTPEELQQMKAQELADLKEEQEAVKEIEAVFRKGEVQPTENENLRKVKDISIDDDKVEKEEYLIIEKEEIDHDSLDEKETKENETQKLARDSEESEKQRKLSAEEQIIEKHEEIQEQVNNIVTEAEGIVKAKEDIVDTKKDLVTPDEKLDVSSTDKKTTDKEAEEEVKDIIESQPDEKVSGTIKSGDTTTAPTLPEDERIPLDEIKEQIIEEKHVKEETKEKEVPVIQLPPKTFDPIAKIPGVVGIRLDKQSHIRDIVKTPDEVADLPVHEEVDYEYTHELKADIKTNEIIEDKKDVKADDKVQETEQTGYAKEQAKEVEQEKDKDEVVSEQLKDIIGDVKKTSVMQEELKNLTETVLQNEVILEKDILKDTEKIEEKEPLKSPTDIPQEKLTEEIKTIEGKPEELDVDLTKVKEEPKKEASKEKEADSDSEKEQIPGADILEKADVETKEKVDLKAPVLEESKVEGKEATEKDVPEAKTEASKETKIEEKVETDELTKIEKTDEVEKAKSAEEKIDQAKKQEPTTKIDVIEKDEPKDTKVDKVEKEQVTKVEKQEQIIQNEIDELEEPLDIVKKEEKDTKTEKIDAKEDNKVADESPKDEKPQAVEEPLVNGEVLDEESLDSEEKKDEEKDFEVKKVVKTETESKILEATEESKPEKVDGIKEKADTIVKETIEKDKDLEEKTTQKEVPSVEALTTELTKQSEEMIAATKESKVQLEKIEEKLQQLKETSEYVMEKFEPKKLEDDHRVEKSEEIVRSTKEGVGHLEKLNEKLQELKKSCEPKIEIDQELEEIGEKEQKIPGDIIEKMELGRKSPKEREEDVIKIVASVAEVLKSDAPLEEFEGKLPISTFSPFTASYTTELRETHITTVDSPVGESKVIKSDIIATIPEEPHSTTASFLEEERKVVPVEPKEEPKDELREEPKEESKEEPKEEPKEKPEDKRSSLLKQSQELMMATSKMISDIKGKTDEKDDQDLDDQATVHRMLVTASSEDGGEETELCPPGTIVFPKSSESSGRSSPEKSQELSKKSSIVDTISDSLSTVKQVRELCSEKDSGIDDVKSDTDLEAQEKLSPTPDADVKPTTKETEELISQATVSGKSSPDKDASIKSLASGKSTPDISDLEKSKEIASSLEDLKKHEELSSKETEDLTLQAVVLAKEVSGVDIKPQSSPVHKEPSKEAKEETDLILETEILPKEVSGVELKPQSFPTHEEPSKKAKEGTDLALEAVVLSKEVSSMDLKPHSSPTKEDIKSEQEPAKDQPKAEHVTSKDDALAKETSKAEPTLPESPKKEEKEEKVMKLERRDSLIDKIEDTIKDQFEAVSDFTKSLFGKGEKEIAELTEVEKKEDIKELSKEVPKISEDAIEEVEPEEGESILEKIEDKIKDAFEAIVPSLFAKEDKKEAPAASPPTEDIKDTKETLETRPEEGLVEKVTEVSEADTKEHKVTKKVLESKPDEGLVEKTEKHVEDKTKEVTDKTDKTKTSVVQDIKKTDITKAADVSQADTKVDKDTKEVLESKSDEGLIGKVEKQLEDTVKEVADEIYKIETAVVQDIKEITSGLSAAAEETKIAGGAVIDKIKETVTHTLETASTETPSVAEVISAKDAEVAKIEDLKTALDTELDTIPKATEEIKDDKSGKDILDKSKDTSKGIVEQLADKISETFKEAEKIISDSLTSTTSEEKDAKATVADTKISDDTVSDVLREGEKSEEIKSAPVDPIEMPVEKIESGKIAAPKDALEKDLEKELKEASLTTVDRKPTVEKLVVETCGVAEELEKELVAAKEAEEATIDTLEKVTFEKIESGKTAAPKDAPEKDLEKELKEASLITVDRKPTVEKLVVETCGVAEELEKELVAAKEAERATIDTLEKVTSSSEKSETKDSILDKLEETTKAVIDSVLETTSGKLEDDLGSEKDDIVSEKTTLPDEPKKRRESIIEQIEGGVISTFSAISDFGKHMFDKGEKVIEDSAAKLEHFAKDAVTKTESIVENIEDDIKSSVSAVLHFDESMLQDPLDYGEDEEKTSINATETDVLKEGETKEVLEKGSAPSNIKELTPDTKTDHRDSISDIKKDESTELKDLKRTIGKTEAETDIILDKKEDTKPSSDISEKLDTKVDEGKIASQITKEETPVDLTKPDDKSDKDLKPTDMKDERKVSETKIESIKAEKVEAKEDKERIPSDTKATDTPKPPEKITDSKTEDIRKDSVSEIKQGDLSEPRDPKPSADEVSKTQPQEESHLHDKGALTLAQDISKTTDGKSETKDDHKSSTIIEDFKTKESAQADDKSDVKDQKPSTVMSEKVTPAIPLEEQQKSPLVLSGHSIPDIKSDIKDITEESTPDSKISDLKPEAIDDHIKDSTADKELASKSPLEPSRTTTPEKESIPESKESTKPPTDNKDTEVTDKKADSETTAESSPALKSEIKAREEAKDDKLSKDTNDIKTSGDLLKADDKSAEQSGKSSPDPLGLGITDIKDTKSPDISGKSTPELKPGIKETLREVTETVKLSHSPEKVTDAKDTGPVGLEKTIIGADMQKKEDIKESGGLKKDSQSDKEKVSTDVTPDKVDLDGQLKDCTSIVDDKKDLAETDTPSKDPGSDGVINKKDLKSDINILATSTAADAKILEEKALEKSEEALEVLTDMAKSVVFDKCEKSSAEIETMDEKLLKKEEEVLEKSAEDIKKAFETVSDMSKSVVFEKCEKHPEEVEVMDEKLLKQEEQVLEKSADDIKEAFEAVSDMSKSLVFEKCEKHPSDGKTVEETYDSVLADFEDIDPKILKQEEKQIERSTEDLKEAYETVLKMSQSISFDKCEKPEDIILHKEEKALAECAEDLKETFETVEDMSKSVVFERCDSIKERRKSLVDELVEKNVEDVKEAFEAVSAMSKSVIFEKCDKEDHKEKSDSEKELFDEKSGKHLSDSVGDVDTKSVLADITTAKDLPSKVLPELKAKDSDIKDITEAVKSDIDTKSIAAELKKSPELLVADNKLEKSPDITDAKPVVFEKCEKETMEKTASESRAAKGIIDEVKESKGILPVLEKKVIKDELNKLDSKLEEQILEPKQKQSTLVVAEAETKKLSISDVEISLSDIKATPCSKDASTQPIQAERLSIDKSDIKEDNQKTESKDTEDSCDKTKESIISIAGPSTTKDGAAIEKQKELQETLLHEKHIPGAVTPPTVPVSPNVIDSYSEDMKLTSRTEALIKEMGLRSSTPGSDDFEIITSTHSDISSGQVSKLPLDSEKLDSDEEDQLSVTSQVVHSRDSSNYDLEEDVKLSSKMDPMSMSFYGSLPDEHPVETGEKQVERSYLYEITKAKYSSGGSVEEADVKLDHLNKNKQSEAESLMTASFIGDLPSSSSTSEEKKDPIETWGKPLGLPAPPTYLYEITKAKYTSKVVYESPCDGKIGYEDLYEVTEVNSKQMNDDKDFDLDQINMNEQVYDVMSSSFFGVVPSSFGDDKDPIASWGKPLGLPSPAPPNDNKGTPKKERKLPPNVTAKNKLNDDKKRAESPSKYRNKKVNPVYVDLTYVPHHGNSYYSYVEFFKKVRARYYVFSGIEPSREVYNALLEAKQTWEDKELEVTIIPTYDTDILGYWVAENEELLTKYKIDLSPSASRCTINLQDHETSCSAYRLEF